MPFILWGAFLQGAFLLGAFLLDAFLLDAFLLGCLFVVTPLKLIKAGAELGTAQPQLV